MRRTAALLLAGLVAPQLVLYAPSLFGDQVLLPLEVLRAPVYLPASAGPLPSEMAGDIVLSDAVFQMEPQRLFAAREVRAGHLPLWDPFNYCGAPFLAANQPALLSPLRLLDYLWPSPRALAWREVLKALIAGIGAFLFFRRVLRAGEGAALFGAWCFPLSGYLVLWANHPHASVALWLPWVLLFTEGALAEPRSLQPLGLALSVAVTLQSGHSGIAAHVLLGSALFALGRIVALRARLRWPPLAALFAGWLLGAMLSAVQTLPTLDYLQSSLRILDRLRGEIETQPAGLGALVELALPYAFGSSGEGLVNLQAAPRLESAAAGYVGLVAALCLAPLGWARARERGLAWALALLAVVGVAQIAGLPLLGELLMRGAFATLRNNRLVLLTGFAALSLAVLGLDGLLAGAPSSRWTQRGAALVALALGAWSCSRALATPPELQALVANARALALAGKQALPLFSLPLLEAARPRLAELAWIGAGLCAASALSSLLLARHRRLAPLVGALALGELVWAAAGVNPQRPRALYYPPIPALEAVKQLPWGRALCVDCLPAELLSLSGLHDVRGYDGADPKRMVQLLELFRAPSSAPFPYARVEWFQPRLPSPLADLLGLRYLIFRGSAPAGSQPVAQSDGYYVMENPDALPRAFVPERWAVERDEGRRLARLGDPSFSPRRLALLEEEVPLADAPARGSAEVALDSGDRVLIDVRMATPGLLVLADSWAEGWRAYVGETELPVLPVDHALRAVALPAGAGQVEFRYQPRAFALGLAIASSSAGFLGLWFLLVTIATRRARRHIGSSS